MKILGLAVLMLALASCACTNGSNGADAGEFDAGGEGVDAGVDAGAVDSGVVDAGMVPTVMIAAPQYLTSGATGVQVSVMQTDAEALSWAIVGGAITDGAMTSQVTLTVGPVGKLVLVCTAMNAVGAATAVAEVTVVAAPSVPVIHFLSGSEVVPVATKGRLGLTAFVAKVAGMSHTWAITGGSITSATTGDSIVYTAGTEGSLSLSVIETNAAGDQSSPGTATQPLADGSLSLWAGALGGPGNLDGIGSAARLSYPTDVAFARDGTAYIVDQDNASIRALSPAGVLTTLTDAGLTYPGSISVGADGGLYVTDLSRIKSVHGDGTVTTVAGNGSYGWKDDAGLSASFGALGGITTDSSGAVFVSDWGFGTIRKLTPLSDGGWVTSTVRAGLTNPRGLVVASGGSLYVAAASTCALSVIAGSNVSVIAGDGGCGAVDGPFGVAQFDVPWGVRMNAEGALLITETYNRSVRVVRPDAGLVSTLGSVSHPLGFDVDGAGNAVVAQGGLDTVTMVSDAGSTLLVGAQSQAGAADGDAGVARFAFYGFGQLGIDPRTGQVLVTDSANQTLRAASFDAVGGATVRTLAGSAGQYGFADGPLMTSKFNAPAGVAVDPSTGLVWVADQGNAAIRAYSLSSQTVSTPVGGGTPCNGSLDGIGLKAGLCSPSAVAVDSIRGLVYVADSATHRVYSLTPSGQADGTYRARAIVGTGTCGFSDTALCAPAGLAVDVNGVLYIADTGNNAIRSWANSTLTTIAGGTCSSADGSGAAIGLCAPQGLVFAGGFLYVADTGNGTIRKLTNAGGSWSSTTELGQAGRHGTVLSGAATLNRPTSVGVTPWGDLVILEANENSLLLYRQQ